MSCHIIFPVKFLMTNFARVGIPLKVGGYIMPVEVARMGVGIIAHFTPISVLGWSLVGAKAADADRVGALRTSDPVAIVGIKVGQLRFNLLLHLEVHKVGRGTWGTGL